MSRRIVIALGGNALSTRGTDPFDIQMERARRSMAVLASLVADGWQIAITHGNGPQVGNALRRVELSQSEVIPLPLSVCGAQTQGEIGFILALTLGNHLYTNNLDKPVIVVATRVIVDADDPGFKNPTKFIGRFYTDDEAKKLMREQGWIMKSDVGRGWRRVVPSPLPIEIVERNAVRKLLDEGAVVISTGGGGIPVIEKPDGSLDPVDAVIDKDRASAVLAKNIGAKKLIIITGVDRVSINFGKPEQTDLGELNIEQAKKYYNENQFPPGSMGPKIESAIKFIEDGGQEVIITSISQVAKSFKNEGRFTRIIP
ncbi:carbamate kinase [bacterium]|nr:carbamate kinase [bacterium]